MVAGTGQFTIAGWQYIATESGSYQDIFNKGGAFQFGRQTGSDKQYLFVGGVDEASSVTLAEDAWHHVALTRGGTQMDTYVNGTDVATESASGWDVDVSYDTLPVKINYGSSGTPEMYVDQVLFYTGVALSSTHIGHLRGGGNGNTTFGALGGVILHEEYTDGTNAANAATGILLHSNNATHHTKGSRYFYNDVANTRFTGTTGHEHAGYFTVGVSGTAFTILGAHQTNYSPAMTQPSIRLRRGYSYVFAASSLGSHKFYFANSTANSTGYAYGSDASTNKHITGMYVSDTAPTAANKGSLTWTAMTSDHYLGSADSNGFNYLKYEVPTDAPKDLYYRCGAPHGAMGNAVFVMEATEPAPLKVDALPAIKTSTWNDRDFTGTGTNKSVMHFNDAEETHLSVADSADWTLGSTFNISFWVNFSDISATQGFCGQRADANNLWFTEFSSNSLYILIISGDTQILNTHITFTPIKDRWYHINFSKASNAWHTYINGVLDATGKTLSLGAYTASIPNYAAPLLVGAHQPASGHTTLRGFMDEFMIHKGIAFNANTVIEYYQTGRAGNHNTANSSCVLHIKANSTYGDTTFTDSSPSAHTITSVNGAQHHIDDNRTANTALYFDGYSYIGLSNIGDGTDTFDIGVSDFTAECWAKPYDGTATQYIISNGGEGTSNVDGWNIQHISGTTYGFRPTYEEGGTNHSWSPSSVGVGWTGPGHFETGVWQHLAYVRRAGIFQFFVNGICLMNDSTELTLNISGTATFYIGRNHVAADAFFKGWMDGIRITKGMPRYTSGIPTDGQSPHKKYDDGRSSNVSNADWATSSTRRYYGINTHTYLQTTKYATTANTVLLVRGEDAETANDGVNMYGDNGFHLEFKEVGSGDERDYNNFNTGVAGLGSDTSATQEFSDDGTVFLLRSRPNQANGNIQFINEIDQSLLSTGGGSIHHNEAKNIFSADANTANVSIASGGSRTY